MRIRGEKLNTSPAASDRHGPPWRSRAQSSRVQMRVMMHTVMKLLQCTKLHLGRLYICTRTNCWQVVMAHWDAWVLMREVDDDLGEVDDDLGRRRPAHFCLRCKHVLICAKWYVTMLHGFNRCKTLYKYIFHINIKYHDICPRYLHVLTYVKWCVTWIQHKKAYLEQHLHILLNVWASYVCDYIRESVFTNVKTNVTFVVTYVYIVKKHVSAMMHIPSVHASRASTNPHKFNANVEDGRRGREGGRGR